MKNTKRRVLSMLLVVAMLVSVVPFSVFAEDVSGSYVAKIGNTEYQTLETAIDAADNEATVVLIDNVVLDTALKIAKAVTLDLNGYSISLPSDTAGDGVFCVTNGGKLTINGEGTVNGVGNNDYNMALWADGGEIVINGGAYTNVGATDESIDNTHFDLIYVKNGGKVTINGGTFVCETPAWTLNSNDAHTGTFVVNGGKFYDYDPANNTTESTATSWLADGYISALDGEGYYCVSNFKSLVANGGNVTLENDVVLDTAVTVDKEVTVDLNGYSISLPSDTAGDGVFCVTNGGKLTINGEGTVNGVGNNDYNMALWADGGEIVINGGAYTNVGATDESIDNTHFDLIYVKNGGKVTINGGTFVCETPAWTLNSNDAHTGTFVVNGGKFYGYDPANHTTETPAVSWVADGYAVSIDGEYFTVTEFDKLISNGGTVKLMSDVTTDTVILKSGITLDLNGYNLKANYFVAFDGADVIDTQIENKGALIVSKSNLSLSNSNSYMPIYSDGGYTFTKIELGHDTQDGTDDGVKYRFWFEDMETAAHALLKDGVNGNDVTLKVVVSWENDGLTSVREFIYGDDLISGCLAQDDYCFTLTLGGISKVGKVTITSTMVSDTGVEVVSESIVYPANA